MVVADGSARVAEPDDLWTVAVHSAAEPDKVLGAGFLLDRTRVLTCWHVIDRKYDPAAPLTVAFPKAGVSRAVRRTVAQVRGDPTEDLAVLELTEPAPPEAEAAPLRSPEASALRGGRWWAFGFPSSSSLGSEAHGTFGGSLSYGCVALERLSRHPVTGGFSGGGVWSEAYGAVVGMVGTAKTGSSGTAGDAQAITLHRIERVLRDERLQDVTAWSVRMAGDAALGAWGWSLHKDAEAVRHWYPRARGVSVDTESGYRFRGRTPALSRIVGWLSRSRPDRRVLIVTGSPGVGKSAVLGRIVTTADREVRAALPEDDHNVRAPIGSVACAVHVKGKTALEVAVEVAQAASVQIPRTVSELIPALQKRLGRSGERHFNLVVDALDEAVNPLQARLIVKGILVPIARQFGSSGARVVVGSRRRDDGGELLRTFGPAVDEIDLDLPEFFTLDDLTDYALVTLALLGDERLGNPYADAAVAQPVAQRIAELADRNFLIAGLIARSHGMYDTEAVDPTRLKFTDTVDKALAEYLSRLPLVGGVQATTVLTALAYAQAPGLSLSLWQVALDALGVPVPHDALVEFADSAAANFLVETSDDVGTPRYRLFHQALNDALLRGRSQADERALATEFIKHGRENAGGWAKADTYLLRTLPAFAVRAGMIDELLLDDGFLLHADLPRLTPLAGQALTSQGSARGRLLRLTPRAIQARPAERAAMFGVTAEVESQRNTFATWRGLPYRVRWASVSRRAEHSALEGYPGSVRAVCTVVVDRRPHLATVGDFPFVRLWNPASGLHRDLPLPMRSMLAVCVVSWGERELLAVAGHSGRILFVDPADGVMDASLTSPATSIHALAAITVEEEQHLAAGCADGMVRLWGFATGSFDGFTAHNGPIRAMSVLHVGERQLLATGGEDHAARIWRPATKERLRNFTGHIDTVRSVRAITVGGQRLLAAANYCTVTLWDRKSGHRERQLSVDRHGRVRAMTTVVVGGQTCLAVATASGDIVVPDLADGQSQIVLTGHTASVNAACTITIDDRELLVTVGQDRATRLWDLAAADVERQGKGRISAACAVRIGPRQLAAVVADDRRSIRLLDVETGAGAGKVGRTREPVASLCAVTGEKGDLIVSESGYGLIQTWDPLAAQQVRDRMRSVEPLRAICPFRESSGRVVLAIVGDPRTTLRLFSPGSGSRSTKSRLGGWRRADEVADHLRAMHLVYQVSADVLATAGDDPAVMLWRPDGRRIGVLVGHRDSVRALVTVPGDSQPLLATGSDDQTVRLWNPQDGRLVTTLSGHAYGVTALCPVTIGDRTMLASGSRDRTVRVWDIAQRNAVLTIPVHYPVTACLEIAGLLFVGLTAGSLVLDLNAAHNELAHFRRT